MSLVFSRITSKAQTTVPKDVRQALDVGPGDTLAYRVEGDNVIVTKAPAFDVDYLRAIDASFAEEWLSPEDCAAFDDL
ncbi:MAG: AbrB/MazE/SpoVT family DNA-binding domain-containing protein [Caulobacteraceae bacterium]|nr:AbrB/MazE/SpoVT family DNA-binding domain-containing protein [Caulobacteraceae bacterium]